MLSSPYLETSEGVFKYRSPEVDIVKGQEVEVNQDDKRQSSRQEFVEEFHAALVPVKRKLYKRIITVWHPAQVDVLGTG
jgi:hypothetical protein